MNRTNVTSATRASLPMEEVIYQGVITLAEPQNGYWTGTMTQLRRELTTLVGRKVAENLPASPSALRVALNRVVPRLRRVGHMSVRFSRANDSVRSRLVEFAA